MEPLAAFTPNTFRHLVGQGFALSDIAVALELVAVVDLGPESRRGGAFTLLWRGPAEPALEQGTVQLTHPEVGEFPLFLVPVAAGPGSRDYEAVFA